MGQAVWAVYQIIVVCIFIDSTAALTAYIEKYQNVPNLDINIVLLDFCDFYICGILVHVLT